MEIITRISSNTDNVFFIHFVYTVLTSCVLKRIAHLTLIITVINYFNNFYFLQESDCIHLIFQILAFPNNTR